MRWINYLTFEISQTSYVHFYVYVILSVIDTRTFFSFIAAWSNMKASREANARYEVDELQFHRAGRGPLRKTYSYDPTKQFSATQKPAAVMAKKS